MRYTWDENVVSDLHKDAYGFRPSATWWAQWRAMDGDDRQAEWDRLCGELEAEQAREQAARSRSQARWEDHISQLMSTNGIDRATAIRWDMQAEDAVNDAGFYCFLVGIGYHNEEEINRMLVGEVA